MSTVDIFPKMDDFPGEKSDETRGCTTTTLCDSQISKSKYKPNEVYETGSSVGGVQKRR
jgi:hypothetical protein